MTPTPTASSASEPATESSRIPPRRRLRLQQRIVIAVIGLALVSSGGAAWFAVSVTADAFRARVTTQLSESAAAVSPAGLALNPGILRTLSAIVGAQIVTVGADGTVLASSTAAPDPALVAAVRRAAGSAASGSAVVATDCGFPCTLALRQVAGRPGVVVALAADESQVNDVTASVARAIMMSALIGLIGLVVFTQIVVRRLTVPLDRLVRFVRDLSVAAADRGEARVQAGDDVEELSDAFNRILDRLERAQAAVVRSEKLALTGLFAARVAHDIRNPLSSIKLRAQMLAAHVTDPDASTTLASVRRDVEQVEYVVSDLMELARPGELRRERTPLNDVVREALQHLGAQMAHRKIEVSLQLEEGMPDATLDRQRFKHALLNLLVNSSEAMHTGGHMRIATRRAGDRLCVEIADDGVGIPADLGDRVFEPFVSTKPDGVGLGLVNARFVVEGHGGRITLERRQPRGTLARILLPVPVHG